MSEVSIRIEGVSLLDFYGVNNSKLSILKRAFPRLKIVSRGSKLKVTGSDEDIEILGDKVRQLINFLEQYGKMSEADVEKVLAGQSAGNGNGSAEKGVLVYGPHGKLIRAKTPNQQKMVDSMEKNDIMFSIGPAGTGKTYTAVAIAARALRSKLVRKIILTRPAVEAGESLGFLPGDLKEKIDPYLRPLYDALDDMIPVDKLNYYMQNRIIEIAPLAFMRGRTLDNAYIILDEAQNCTESQLKMFLTRIGPSAKCIITGDLTQIDLPRNQTSGLSKTLKLLDKIDGIARIDLDEKDVIRHRLVREIIKAFGRDDAAKKK